MLRRTNSELEAKNKKATEFASVSLDATVLDDEFDADYFAKAGSAETGKSTSVTLSSVLREMSLTEEPSQSLFDEALRGAIAVRSSDDYDAIRVSWEIIDRVILKFADIGVVRFVRSGRTIGLQFGVNWIAAHTLAKQR